MFSNRSIAVAFLRSSSERGRVRLRVRAPFEGACAGNTPLALLPRCAREDWDILECQGPVQVFFTAGHTAMLGGLGPCVTILSAEMGFKD